MKKESIVPCSSALIYLRKLQSYSAGFPKHGGAPQPE